MEKNLQKSNRINSTFIFNRIVISEFHYFRILLFYIYRSRYKRAHASIYENIFNRVIIIMVLLYLQEREYIFKNYNRKTISLELQYI